MHRPIQSPTLPLPLDAPLPWLGGLSARAFMRDHWQKKPLFVPGAFPGFATAPQNHLPMSVSELLDLAQGSGDAEDIELPVRWISEGRMRSGPLRRPPPQGPRAKPFSLLVQQTNAASLAADLFLDHFRFIPEARLDDLMVSLANAGGGIGAHVDSYDVFLIQGEGERLWETAATFDRSLAPSQDLRVLANFVPEWQAHCKPGDLLYLPPGIAHRGTATTDGCTTLSVGFRTASPQHLLEEAMMAKAESMADMAEATTGLGESAWRDPDLLPSDSAGEVPSSMQESLVAQIRARMPTTEELLRGIALGLSSPHPDVHAPPFEPPRDWRQCLRSPKPRHHLRLAPGVRMLHASGTWVIHGQPLAEVLGCSEDEARRASPIWSVLAGRQPLSTEELRRRMDGAAGLQGSAIESWLGALLAQGLVLLLKQELPKYSVDSLHSRHAQA